MEYNTKNYTEQGGEKTIIGGELNITEEGKLSFDDVELKPAQAQNLSTAETIEELVADFNALIQKLKVAGLMQSE